MPFGLVNAPSVFQRFLSYVFRPMLESGKISLYLDDVLIATEGLQENLENLEEVLKIMAEHGLELRLDKCIFGDREIDYMGYTVSERGIKPSKTHVRAILNYPVPTNVKAVQRFLGLAGYFRKFVRDFSLIAKPLYALIRKNAKFVFGEVELKAFEALIERLTNEPVLALFSPQADTELHTDASASGLGVILMQRQEDGKMHPVLYFSKRTTEAESRYHSYELETLAIVSALDRFRVYLHGRPFVIFTDCNALKLTLNKKEINPRISRWALLSQEYDYKVEHRIGERMLHVDALSRGVFMLEPACFEQMLLLKQQTDPEIGLIREALEEGESNRYESRNGIVFRKFRDVVLFYVPDRMVQQCDMSLS
jgi:Reverse transcriptase (RNA-dependent DNA polymerase).